MVAKPRIIVYISFLFLSIVAFFVAATKSASAGAAFEALTVAMAVALLICAVYAIVHLFHSTRLARLSSFAQAQEGGWIAATVTVLVALAVSKWTFVLLEYLLIRHTYGPDAWAQGLRVIPFGAKRGGFSNGDELSGWPELMLVFGTFAVTAVLCAASYLSLRYVGWRLKGRRLSNRAA